MDLAKISFQYGSTISNAYRFLSSDSKVCLLCEQTFMSNDNAHLVKEVEDHVLKHHFLKSVFFSLNGREGRYWHQYNLLLYQ